MFGSSLKCALLVSNHGKLVVNAECTLKLTHLAFYPSWYGWKLGTLFEFAWLCLRLYKYVGGAPEWETLHETHLLYSFESRFGGGVLDW